MACFIPREFVPVAMFMLYRVVVVSLSLVVVPWFPSVSHPPFFFLFLFSIRSPFHTRATTCCRFKEEKYFWEIILATRKIGIVAISVFGRSIGAQRQAQLALFILFISITLEIIGEPYRAVTERHKVLGRLELASLFSLWGTMWCGTLIFASQAPEEGGFVTFLSIVVATVNVSTMLWLVLRLLSECAFEKKESNFGRAVRESVQSLCKRALWKTAAVTKTEVNTGEVTIELTSSSLNPLYGATPEVTNVAAEGCSSNLAQPVAQPVARPIALPTATYTNNYPRAIPVARPAQAYPSHLTYPTAAPMMHMPQQTMM